jgi:RNA ligase partner protein
MEKFILDANLFFNMEAGFNLGKKTDEVIANLTSYAEKLRGRVEFLMPPSAIEEFLSFFEDKNQPQIKKLLSLITSRSPSRNQITISIEVFYQLIEEIKKRSYRGLNLGEEEIIKAGRLMSGVGKMSEKEFEIKIGEVIKNFRSRYRTATRTGFIDSLTDLDLIILTKETDGFLVSSDEGVIRWGRVFGIKEVLPSSFRLKLDSFLHHQE